MLQVPAIRNRAMNGMGITDRVELWKINFEFFKRRPLTGVGCIITSKWREPGTGNTIRNRESFRRPCPQ